MLDLFFFWCRPFKKSYWICYNIVSVWCCDFFGCEACGILVPWLGIEPAPSALEGEVLSTGPPGKSPTDARSISWSAPQLLGIDNGNKGASLVAWMKKNLPSMQETHLSVSMS